MVLVEEGDERSVDCHLGQMVNGLHQAWRTGNGFW